MTIGERYVQDALDIMRLATGRRNENDPDASDDLFLSYLNDFVSLTMPNDTKLFESFGTLSFTIDQTNTTGVYNFNEIGADTQFMNISSEAFISILNPVNNSVSWNWLPVYQDPGQFFMIWGINNDDILVPGYPTGVLYYGNQFTFRTIPNIPYLVKFYGYTKNQNYPTPDVPIQYDYWLRYIAYGAAVNYARDFRYPPEERVLLEATFKSERKYQLTHVHNQVKVARSMPRF